MVFYTQVIGLIWMYMFGCWKQQNHHLHLPDHVHPDYHVLAEQVQHIVDMANNDPALAHVAPMHMVEQILQQPIPRIHEWAQCGAQLVQNYLTATHNVLYYTHMISKTSSDPGLIQTCNHHNQLHYFLCGS